MRVLDLFAGIGGFSLGLERAGFRTVAFCENEPYCRAVLRQRWPGVMLYNDVRELDAATLVADGIACDVICGGFPCTDLSVAGKGVGITGPQSGLWREFARLIGELRPRYVLVENVAALIARGLGTVLGDLAALGFDAEWHCIPAAYVGAPHRRDRIWVVAYPDSARLLDRSETNTGGECAGGRDTAVVGSEVLADTNGVGCERERFQEHGSLARAPGHLADRCSTPGPWAGTYDSDASRERLERLQQAGTEAWTVDRSRDGRNTAGWWWSVEPPLGRVADGIPHRVERLRALGNALVPQIAEMLGAAILQHEKSPRERVRGL